MSEGTTLEFQNATIVDGSGDAPFEGHVLVEDSCITKVATSPTGADLVVDLGGIYLAPGFVDMHAHSELRLFERPDAVEKLTQGITLEVMGQDGVSVAPVPDGLTEEWVDRTQSLLGGRDEWPWTTVGEFLGELETARPAVNCAYYAPHGNLRSTVARFEDRPLTAEECEQVRKALHRAIDHGAFAMSKGMIYPPSAYGRDPELVELAEVLCERDTYMVSHVWNETDRVVESIERYLDICQEGGCQPLVSHLKVGGQRNWGASKEVLELFDAAERDGVTVTFDQYPYRAGSTMLTALLPPWVREGTTADIVERLEDSSVRDRIRNDLQSESDWENLVRAAGTWDNILVTRTKSRQFEGETLSDIADERGVTPVDALCDLLVAEDLDATMVDFIMDEEDIARFLADERGTVCTDGIFGGKPHPRATGTFPRILERYVRSDGPLSVERAVYKMAGRPADVLGLADRGRVREGYVADLVAFDLDAVHENATYDNPLALSDGIEHVAVNGTLAISEGERTDARPGEVLRSRDAWDGRTRPKIRTMADETGVVDEEQSR